MVNVMYSGPTIIITQNATHGTIHYLEEGVTRDWSLDWNELLLCYADAIGNDNNEGKYFNEDFKEIMKEYVQ